MKAAASRGFQPASVLLPEVRATNPGRRETTEHTENHGRHGRGLDLMVRCLAIASLGEALMELPSATKTTEKKRKSSLYPFLFSRFPNTDGINSPQSSIVQEPVPPAKSPSVPCVILRCSLHPWIYCYNFRDSTLGGEAVPKCLKVHCRAILSQITSRQQNH